MEQVMFQQQVDQFNQLVERFVVLGIVGAIFIALVRFGLPMIVRGLWRAAFGRS